MALLSLLHASLAFGHVPLLDDVDFSLEGQERVGLIGRNGTGKSSMLRILGRLEAPDDGTLHVQQGVRIAFVPQEPALALEASVFEVVSQAFESVIRLREDYQRAHESGGDPAELDRMQSDIEAQDGWVWEQRVEETLARLNLPRESRISTLSGGVRKRVALARALAVAPDVLLLDEPTNHLDIDAIRWLEDLLRDWRGSVVVITHDRAFLDRVATRIVELDRGRLRSYPCNFAAYETQKEMQLEQESTLAAKADKLLAQEEVWIRKGVEARRTRSQSRIERLQQLRRQRAERREQLGRVQMDVATGAAGGKIVAELTDVSISLGGRKIVDNFSATFLRGDRVGILGPNGAGKTTLLKLILGELAPDAGRVRQGANLQIAYFDQMRAALDPEAKLEDFISPGSEWIEINGQRKHVKSYLGDFLFSPARASAPVRTLSGGERNRLLLARLFARPANVLVLDEPTNDLDIDTLELLEELLQSYAGTVFLVSHDRRFVDNVVTSIVAWEGDQSPGRWREYEGSVEDWIVQSERTRIALRAAEPLKAAPATPSSPPAAAPTARSAKKKLSYKEQRELDGLPDQIASLEAEQSRIREQLADSAIYMEEGGQRAKTLHDRDGEIEEALMTALERWEQLSA